MLDFHRLRPEQRREYEQVLFSGETRGCEYSFANLYLWGWQQTVFTRGCVAFFSHFSGRSIYPFPIGPGDKKGVIEDILEDARQRGIPCRITNLLPQEAELLEQWFPGRFHFRSDRSSFDYVYDISDLADLKGRKFQKKRNHLNRFRAAHPDCRVVPLDPNDLGAAQDMVHDWYARRLREDPQGDYMLESIAMGKAFRHYEALAMEGIALVENGAVLAVTMGSRLSGDTFDIHFEKAREDVDGAYTVVNAEFAAYLREKHPELRYLNREDDLGLEGLRKAKLSYNPHHLTEKLWAYLREEAYAD